MTEILNDPLKLTMLIILAALEIPAAKMLSQDRFNGAERWMVMGMAEIFAGGHLRFTNGAWRDDNGDSVEIAKVVRCKDCKYWKPGDSFGGNSLDDMQRIGRCPIVRFGRRENDFCCEGERRTDGR